MGRLVWLFLLALLALGLWFGPRPQDFDLSARTTPPEPLTDLAQWLKEKSIQYQSRGLQIPEPAPNAMAAIHLYAKSCMVCHGGPGVLAHLPLKGMRPEPTDLSRDDVQWAEPQLFFIIKNGIMGSGMPAYGPVLEDKEIWELASLVKLLPQISPKSFQALIQSGKPAPRERHKTRNHRPIKDAFFEADDAKGLEHFQ